MKARTFIQCLLMLRLLRWVKCGISAKFHLQKKSIAYSVAMHRSHFQTKPISQCRKCVRLTWTQVKSELMQSSKLHGFLLKYSWANRSAFWACLVCIQCFLRFWSKWCILAVSMNLLPIESGALWLTSKGPFILATTTITLTIYCFCAFFFFFFYPSLDVLKVWARRERG